MADDAKGPCWDTLFLGLTRMACVYGVPLAGFVVAVGGCALVFDLTPNYNVWWRLAYCATAAGLTLFVMAALTSREPKWFQIGLTYARTSLPAKLSRQTRHFGGTTFTPLPQGKSFAEVRDYVG